MKKEEAVVTTEVWPEQVLLSDLPAFEMLYSYDGVAFDRMTKMIAKAKQEVIFDSRDQPRASGPVRYTISSAHRSQMHHNTIQTDGFLQLSAISIGGKVVAYKIWHHPAQTTPDVGYTTYISLLGQVK